MSLWGRPLADELVLTWPRRLRQVVLRDTFAFAFVLAISAACVSLIVSWQTAGFLRRQIDAHLLTDARAIAAEPGPQVRTRLSLAIGSDLSHKRVGAVFDANGARIEGNLQTVPRPLPAPGTMGTIDDPKIDPPPGTGRIRVGRITLPDGRMLIFGRRVDELDLVDVILVRTLLLAGVPTVVFSCLGGWAIWRLRVGRLRAVEAACHRIMAGDFHQRLPATRRTDELRVVSLTINRMLDEVERLMLELRGAGDAMAHDLRTPLTRLRTRLGRVADSDMDLAATKSAIGRMIEDVDQLIAIIRAMLRLGAIESGQHRASFGPIDIGPVALAAAELYAPIAEEKGLVFVSHAGEGVYAVGDAELLFEAIANLLDNAVKFTPAGGAVGFTAAASAGRPRIQIDDTGPGIAAHEREAVKRRFYRGDPARGIHGNGLGLAIVAAVARLHGSELELSDGPGGVGCRAALTLPADNGRSIAREHTGSGNLPAARTAPRPRIGTPA
jgi:signal transduction histidine kinase